MHKNGAHRTHLMRTKKNAIMYGLMKATNRGAPIAMWSTNCRTDARRETIASAWAEGAAGVDTYVPCVRLTKEI